jgi:hypothetical protein
MIGLAILIASLAAEPTHPRLYFTADDLPTLRAQRTTGVHARIWANLAESADWCLEKTPRAEWIAPAADDPIYENLYDRFYAMMMDMAITEHLAFAYALSGEERYGNAARDWTLACARAWRPDADAEPDGGKAYAVMRLLKGTAVGYDLAYDRFTEAERAEIRDMLAKTATNYFEHYFQLHEKSGAFFHTHHAVVEYSSFGVAALALLGEVPEAEAWLAAAVKKFEDHLLPMGLAQDGAQVEGATFWASTMHYRLFFMDALRRVTGKDLFTPNKKYMNADLALAGIAGVKEPGWNESHQSVIFEPPYGQLDYYAPILLFLAREYKRPIYQHLALWDKSLGHIQQTRYITPNRKEQLLFEFGGYAYVWYDASVKPDTNENRKSFHFRSVSQAYARDHWEPGGLVAGIDKGGQTIVHAGGVPVLIASGLSNESDATPHLSDYGKQATLLWKEGGAKVTMTLSRPDSVRIEWIGLPDSWSFWSLRLPEEIEGGLRWEGGATLHAETGTLGAIDPEGLVPGHAVGNGKLDLVDPNPRKYPTVLVTPEEGRFVVSISAPPAD